MLLREQEKKNMIISGLFIFILSILVMVFIFVLGKDLWIFDSKATIYAYVENAQDLKVGTKVKLKGIKVGKVQYISILDLDKIEIAIHLSSKYLKWIKKDSFINVKTQGVLGDKYLEISGGSLTTSSLSPGGHINVHENSKFDAIINKGEDIAIITARVMKKIDQLLDVINHNKITNIIDNLQMTSKSTSSIANNLNKINLAKLANDLSSTTQSLNKSLVSVDHITARIKDGPGSLHSLIYDLDIHEDLKVLLGGANRNKVLKYFIRESIKSN